MVLTPAQLKDLVRLDGTGLTLQTSALGSPVLERHLAPLLPGGVLTLRGAARTETAGGVQVTGTGVGGLLDGLAVTADLAAGTPEATARLTATTNGPWSLLPAFPPLKNTLWERCRFAGVTLTFDSTAAPDDAGQIPMAFTGTLIVTTELIALDLLFAGTSHVLTGHIGIMTAPAGVTVAMTPVPRIMLSSAAAPDLHLGLVTLTARRYDLYAVPIYNELVSDFDVLGRVVVTASVPLEIGGTAEQVTFFAEVAGWDTDVVLRAAVDDVPALDLGDVAAFAGQGRDGLAVPMDVDITAPITLTGITLAVRPDLTVAYLAIALQTQESWDITDEFALEAIDVLFRVDDPLGSPKLRGTLSGLIGFGANGVVELQIDFDARALAGVLRAGDGPLGIREIYQDLTGADGGHLPDLTVDRFELWGALPHDGKPVSFTGALDLSGTWQITDDLALAGVGVTIAYGAGTTFQTSGDLVVGGVEVYVTAGYATGTGWTFSGRTPAGQAVAIGAFVNELAAKYGAFTLPAPLAGLTVDDLGAEVATAEGTLVATAGIAFPIDTTEVDLALTIDTGRRTLDGVLTVRIPTSRVPDADLVILDFELHLAEDPAATRYAAGYVADDDDPAPTLQEVAAAIVPTAAAYVPDGLVVGIEHIVVAADGTGAHLLDIALKATVDLARLPLVGPMLSGDQVMGFDPLRVLAATAAWSQADVAALADLLPGSVAPPSAQDLPAGLTFEGRLRLGALEAPVVLPATPGQTVPPTPVQAQTSDGVVWRKVQTSLGPVHVERVGLSYLHAPNTPVTLAVLVDAAIEVGGLTLALSGLSAAVALDDPAALPTFDLAGLSVDYAEGPVKISGAFLKDTLTYQGKTYPAFNGKAVIETATFTVGALGSYVQLDEGPSLFVYAFLDYPIGGPAFFFVTGLAAGFGYDRRIIAPDVSQVASFPLVAEALGTEAPSDLAGELHRLESSIPPEPGEYFLAIGVHFTSFQMIDSFLLLTVAFGLRTELNVLGLSTLVLPAPDAGRAPATPIAEIQLALKATFAPDDGYFSLLAQLTENSYLLSRSCRLTGGFAFVTWFTGEHAGDFVLTVGGYHPHFDVPAHYPTVPRLGFNWQVSSELVLKGSAYYAMTPSALMAGGSLSATWQDGSLSAWFDAALDFLIAWQPYHYEASLHISVGARYTFDFFGTHTINVHVGTDVDFWGPEFGGTATLDLSVVSITIRFGAQGSDGIQPVPWTRFRDAQLPPADSTATIALAGGAVHSGDGTDLGIVDPLRLTLVTDAAIPSTHGLAGTTALPAGTPFGVAPAGLTGGFTSTHTITITREGGPAESSFTFTPVTKDLPAALWGGQLTPSLAAPALVPGLLTGYTVTAKPPIEATGPASLPAAALQATTSLFTEQDAFDWQPLKAFTPAATPAFDPGQGAATRAAIAAKLLPDAPVDLGGLTAADYLEAPQVAHV